MIPSSRDAERAASAGPVDPWTRGPALRVVFVEDPRLTVRSMIERGEVDVCELWLQYIANGGNASQLEFEAFLYDASEPSALDLNLLGLTVRGLLAFRKPS